MARQLACCPFVNPFSASRADGGSFQAETDEQSSLTGLFTFTGQGLIVLSLTSILAVMMSQCDSHMPRPTVQSWRVPLAIARMAFDFAWLRFCGVGLQSCTAACLCVCVCLRVPRSPRGRDPPTSQHPSELHPCCQPKLLVDAVSQAPHQSAYF